MKPRIVRSAALLALLAFVGCATTEGPERGAARTNTPTETGGLVAHVAHDDGRVDAPSFVWVSRSAEDRASAPFATPEAATTATLLALRQKLHLSKEALAAIEAPVVHDAGGFAIVTKVVQRVNGREVFRGAANVVLRRDLEPVSFSGQLAPSLEGSLTPFTVGREPALALAFRAVVGHDLDTSRVLESSTDGDTTTFESPLFAQPVRVKEVFFPERGRVEPAYRVELLLTSGESRSVVVSAEDGRVLFTNDLRRYEANQYRVWASPETLMPMDGPHGNGFAPHPTGRADGTKITYVPPQLVTLQNVPFSKNDPWLPAGATETRGNNVDAYSDVVSPNGFSASSADTRATATAPGVFDYTYDTQASPNATPESVRGAVTHLFYVANFMHDWMYDAGFDEKSGNHQADNLGRGGRGNDRLLIEAQDYSGRNNANAATPADGASPRVQMYVFAGQTTGSLVVEAPASVAGTKNVGIAGAFGKDKFVTNGPVVMALDSGADDKDGCENILNATELKDKIALVHRGNCSFSQKAQKVQAAGAIGVIVANVASSSSPGTAPYMGGQAGDVTIPALSLNLADGQALEAALPQGVTVTMRRQGTSDLDGGLDTAIVAHEWGHVLSNRLVGNADGLTTNQAGGLGEGWSDFVAQLLMARPDDLTAPQGAGWAGAYPTGTYATSGSGDDAYFGIRRQPYSTDMKKNGLTFRHISDGEALPKDVPTSFGEDGSNNSEVHATGEVWAQMLWECYAALLSDPRYTFAQAQERMKKYLVASLKATPVDPTLLEARDALIAVAYATDEGDFQAFWKAFAKRGAGVGATGPGKTSFDNKGTKESFVVGNEIEVVSAVLTDDAITCDKDGILDTDEVGSVELTIRNAGAGTLEKTRAKLSTKAEGVAFADGGELVMPKLKPFEIGKAKLKVTARGARPIGDVEVEIAIDDPTLAVPRTIPVRVPTVRDADEADGASTKDEVQTKGTSWVVAGKDRTGTSQKWSRVYVGKNAYWSIPNAGEPADHKLTSASFKVEGDAFGLKFKHRFAFESDARRKKDFDGGVVEVSLDGGTTWKDASEYGPVDYNVTLDNDTQGTNPLKGRKAFGNKSEGYPDVWREEVIKLRTGPAEAVQVRFRHGADDNAVDKGWDIDDIELTDVASKPFYAFVAHRDLCDENGPKVNAGAGKTVPPRTQVTLAGSGTHPTNAPLTYMWSQVEGPEVTLDGKDSANLVFVSPDVTADTKLTFVLRAHDGALLSAGSRVDVTVSPALDAVPTVSGGCGCHTAESRGESAFATFGLAALVLGVVRRRRAR